MNFFNQKKHASLLTILIWLTLLVVAGQIIFFIIHYKVSDLFDSLVQSSLKEQIFQPIIILPIMGFLLIQVVAYALFIIWTWFVSVSISELFKLSRLFTFWLTLAIWACNCTAVLSLNNYYFPDSFFSNLISTNNITLITSVFAVFVSIALAYANTIKHQQHAAIAIFFILFASIFGIFNIYTSLHSNLTHSFLTNKDKPNIILIGLDSVRPDFVSYFNPHSPPTPHIDSFLNNATIFTNAYTPLARTFPSWMSILTGQYPKHNNARSNLADPDLIHADETLAKALRANGYETIYATDEKRFSNITERYGFDHLLGPRMGINDFILGGLNDFPLTNLMINSSLGLFLFPYNYANRAAAITYEPEKFLQLVKSGLASRTNKPLFLAVHLCISHWPYTWAHDNQPSNVTMADKYQSSVSAVDKQLGNLMKMLQENGALENSIVVLLSDHGTTVGLPNDRFIDKANYIGETKKLHSLLLFKLGTAKEYSDDFKNDYTLNTSYGQGTDVLSLKQYHTLLAFKGFGVNTMPRQAATPVMLFDITPTILSLLNLTSFKKSDGISLEKYIKDTKLTEDPTARSLFIETGHSIAEIETNDIFINKVVKSAIGIYQISPQTGQLFINPAAEKSITRSKQRAILVGDWMLAHYPATTRNKLVLVHKKYSSQNEMTFQKYISPAFFVIANLKTKKWSIGLDSPIAKQAPLKELLQKMNAFYGNEIEL